MMGDDGGSHQQVTDREQQQQHAPEFQDGVAATLMACEELRQTWIDYNDDDISSKHCLIVRHHMEHVVGLLFSLQPRDEVETDLRNHCHSKAASVAVEALQIVTSKAENPEKDNPELERDVQGAIARTMELTLLLHERETSTQQEIIDTYTAYQRKVIRQRVTPSIQKLVARRQWKAQHAESWAQQAEEEDDDDDDGHDSNQKTTHSNVIATILGQASALIHPLIIWKSNLPPISPNEASADSPAMPIHKLCSGAIGIVDEQAQKLTETVAGWCMEDKRVDEFWMGQSANETACDASELGELDNLVDELSYLCELFDRYLVLMSAERDDSSPTTIRDLHAEWTLKYASLERYLTTQQFLSALRLAHPVQIVLGTQIQVPSVVEDAQYLCRRALERAASTRSSHAIGTVAHAIATNVWSTDSAVNGGIHEALLEQKGCYQEDTAGTTEISAQSPKNSNTNSNSFAAALLGALDEDFAKSPPRNASSSNNRPPSAPSSGAFLGLGAISSVKGGDRLQRIRLDTHFCALNGCHSAAAACKSLIQFLDSLLPDDVDAEEGKASRMIHLAREDLLRFSVEYQKLLEGLAAQVVTQFCGSVSDAPVYRGAACLPVLRYYLERDNYDLPNAEALQTAEDDARLTKQLLQPLQESLLLNQLSKCDFDVIVILCGVIVSRVVDLFLDCITSKVMPKPFTDWGSLLLSKQVRMVQNFMSSLMEKLASDQTIPILPQWERLSQAVTALQLEKPSDWSFYKSTSSLDPDTLDAILKLRKDFSNDAITSVVASLRSSSQK